MTEKPFALASVKPEARGILGMRFEDGAGFKVDLKPIIRKHSALERLVDPTVFATAGVGEWGGSVISPHDDRLELAAENLRARAIERAGEYSHERIGNWMARHDIRRGRRSAWSFLLLGGRGNDPRFGGEKCAMNAWMEKGLP